MTCLEYVASWALGFTERRKISGRVGVGRAIIGIFGIPSVWKEINCSRSCISQNVELGC
jgi:hypothetical protein